MAAGWRRSTRPPTPRGRGALVLLDTPPRWLVAPDFPEGVSGEFFEESCATTRRLWGTEHLAAIMTPSGRKDRRFLEWYARYMRVSLSPKMAETLLEWSGEIDVRGVLGAVSCPTLVLQRSQFVLGAAQGGRVTAGAIPGARFVEVAGGDYPWWRLPDDCLDEVQVLLTGVRQPLAEDRMLATVLFTDIVGSTEHAAELGDDGWRRLLDEHHAIVRRHLAYFRGRAVKTTGDGLLATFDGPARAVRCACAIRDDVRRLGLAIRAGLHTGEIELAGDDVRGIAVHIGARVASLAGPGEVLVSAR